MVTNGYHFHKRKSDLLIVVLYYFMKLSLYGKKFQFCREIFLNLSE